MEGTKRCNCCFGYMTHTHIPGIDPLMQFAALFEILCDSGRRHVQHEQWIQQDGSYHLVALYLHVIPLQRMMDKGFKGWFTCHDPSLRMFGMAPSHQQLMRASSDPLAYLLDTEQQHVDAMNNMVGVWTPASSSNQPAQ